MSRATRILACELAAQVMACRSDDSPAPMLWSLTVFFENYIDLGAQRTMKQFGPRKAPKLKLVRR